MNLCSACGIVLRIAVHGEANKLVTLYSRDIGLVTGIAKGAWKSKKRFVNKLEEFSDLQFVYRPPSGRSSLLLISEAELLASHLSLRTAYGRYVAAAYISELVLRFTRDSDQDPQLYSLLQWAFHSLDQGILPQKIALLFQLQTLNASGYRPELQCCGQCGQTVAPGRSFVLMPGRGTLLCNVCHGRSSSWMKPLSVQTLKLLAHAQQSEPERLNRLHVSPAMAIEALPALYLYTVHLLQQDLHSWPSLWAFSAGPSRSVSSAGNPP